MAKDGPNSSLSITRENPAGTVDCEVEVKTAEGITKGPVIRMEDPVIVLQRELGLKEDGMLGPKSSAAIELAYGDVTDEAVRKQLPDHVRQAIEAIQDGIGNGMFKQHAPIQQEDYNCTAESGGITGMSLPEGGGLLHESPADTPNSLETPAEGVHGDMPTHTTPAEGIAGGVVHGDMPTRVTPADAAPVDHSAQTAALHSKLADLARELQENTVTTPADGLAGATLLGDLPNAQGEMHTLGELPNVAGEMRTLEWNVEDAGSITVEPLGRAEHPAHFLDAFNGPDASFHGHESFVSGMSNAGFGFASIIQNIAQAIENIVDRAPTVTHDNTMSV